MTDIVKYYQTKELTHKKTCFHYAWFTPNINAKAKEFCNHIVYTGLRISWTLPDPDLILEKEPDPDPTWKNTNINCLSHFIRIDEK